MAGFNANQEYEIANMGGGGYGGGAFGGIFAMIILVVVVLWLLFRDGHKDGHDGGYGYGFGGGCGPCVRPSFIDESNYEEERNINAKLCKIDEDVWKTACETQKETHCEGEKTRALIEQNYIQDLRDTINEKNMAIQTMKSEMFTEKRFDQVLGAIAKMDCECVKRPPVWAECNTPNSHDINCREGFERFDRFPRRGRCDFDCFDCA